MDIAVQQAQQSYKKAPAAAFAALLALAPSSFVHAGIAVRDAPEPLLHDGVKGPCDPQLGRPDFVPGVDVNGNPVAPADQARAKNPVPDDVLVPLRSQGRNAGPGETPVLAMNGKALDPILNPASACPASR
jgi:hypothetical protein